MSDDQLNDLLVKFTPLVRATAFRYTGRGAEFEDLLQEGYLALIILIRRCTDRQWLAAYLLNRLPGYVRAAASRIRGGRAKHHFVDIEDIQDTVTETKSVDERGTCEIKDILERTLSEDERDITQSLLEGFTQKEIAEAYGITQQAVSARLKLIKSKLLPLVGVQDIE